MLKLSQLSLAILALNLVGGSTFAQDNDKKPTPATAASPTNQPRDTLLLPQHDQARNDAEQAYRRSDHKKVVELMSGVLAQNPKDHIALYLRGSSRIDLGAATGEAAMVRAGITDARESITIKQKDNFNYYLPYLKGMTNLSMLENKRAHAEVAITFATQLLSQQGLKGEERSNTLYQRASAHVAIQAQAEVEREQALVKQDQNLAKQHEASAMQRQAQAMADYQEAIRVTPKHLGARIGLANVHVAAGKNAEAMNAFNEAVKAFPDLPLVYNNRGFFQQSIGKTDEAILDFTKVIELDPQFIEAISNRGFVFLNQGKYEEAENDFTQSLLLNAAQPSVLSLRAGSKLSRGDIAAAIADYNEVLKWDSKNSYGHAELGFALFFSDKKQEALDEFEKAAEIDPKLRFLLPWRYLAMLSLNQKSQADANFTADLAIPKDNREWPDQLLIYLGDKQSEPDLRKSINKDPKVADAQICEAEFFIGQRKFIAGQKDAAKVHFAAALKSKSTQLSAYRGAKLAVK